MPPSCKIALQKTLVIGAPKHEGARVGFWGRGVPLALEAEHMAWIYSAFSSFPRCSWRGRLLCSAFSAQLSMRYGDHAISRETGFARFPDFPKIWQYFLMHYLYESSDFKRFKINAAFCVFLVEKWPFQRRS